MSRTVLQVPMDKQLRVNAEKAAHSQGFSSLQEMIRVFLVNLADKRVEVNIEESVQLSAKAIKRYDKMFDDFEKGKNVFEAKDVDDLMRQLNSDK